MSVQHDDRRFRLIYRTLVTCSPPMLSAQTAELWTLWPSRHAAATSFGVRYTSIEWGRS